MPRFMAIILDSPADADSAVSPEEWEGVMAAYNEFGAITRTEQPLAEAKEVVGGFYLLDAADIDEAIEWASQIPGAWLGRVVVQPCIDFGTEG